MTQIQQLGGRTMRLLRRVAEIPMVLPLAVFVVMVALAVAAWDHGILAGSDSGALALLRLSAGLLFAGLVWGLQRSSRRAAAAVQERTKELHESEARFRAISEASPVGIYMCDSHGGLVYANPAYFRITGLTFEQAEGTGWVRYLHPEDRPRLAAEFQTARASGRPFHCLARFLRPDGHIAEIEARCSTVSGPGGLRGLVGTFEDAGERREFERRLEASERQFRNLFDSIGDPIVVTDMARRITRTNPAFNAAFGYDEGALVGSSSVALYESVEAYERAGEWLARSSEGPAATAAGRFRRSSGAIFEADVRLCLLRDDTGQLVGNIAVIRDATDQRAAEAALRESEAFANAIFDNSPIAMHVFDAQGYSLRMNEAQKELLGLPDTRFAVGEFNVLTHGLFERVGLSEKFRRAYEGEVLDLPGVQLEIDPREEAWELGKTDFAYDLTLFPIRDHDGAVQAVVSFTRDISERREAESARRQAEERLRLALGNLPLAAFAADGQGVITFAGGKLLETEGLVSEQIVGVPYATLYSEFPGIVAYINRAAAGEEVQADLRTGGRFFELRCTPLRDAAGRASGPVWVVLDVTASRTGEEARHRSQANLTALIENSDDLIWSVSPAYELLSSNAAFQGMVSGLIGHEIATGDCVMDDDFPPDLRELWTGLYARSLSGERVVEELEIPTPAGTRFHEVRFNPIREQSGRVIGTTVFSRDVTERRLSERALRESEERYRTTFENLHDAFYQTNMRDEFMMVSPSIETLHGWKAEELIGTNSRNLYVDPTRQDELIAFLEAGESVNDFEAELWRKDGSSINVSLNAKLLLSEHGRPYAVQGTSRDISERKRLEAERDRVFNLTVDMLSVVAAGGTLVRVNPAWEVTLGYKSSEVVGTNVWDLVHPDDLERCRDAGRDVDQGRVVTDLRGRFRCKDGSWRWLGWSMTRANDGDVIYCVARDVTELMDAQAEMLRVQDELETTIAALRANQVILEEQTQEMDRLRIAAERLANHDMLTGVANRRAWFAEATRAKPTAVAIFDIDYFKFVNDTYGHPAGDEVLREVARRLQSALPASAFLGRLGGEEFAVLFTGPFAEARDAAAAAALAVGAQPITLEGSLRIRVTVSGGLAPWRVNGRIREQSLADTYEEADSALYEAKSSGRQQLVVRAPKAA